MCEIYCVLIVYDLRTDFFILFLKLCGSLLFIQQDAIYSILKIMYDCAIHM